MALNITTPFDVPPTPYWNTAAGVISATEWNALDINITVKMDQNYGTYWIYFANGVNFNDPAWRVRMQPHSDSQLIDFIWAQLDTQYGGWVSEPLFQFAHDCFGIF